MARMSKQRLRAEFAATLKAERSHSHALTEGGLTIPSRNENRPRATPPLLRNPFASHGHIDRVMTLR